MILSKEIMELRAKYTLKVLLNYDVTNLLRIDKPDLQDNIKSIGIEVVEDCFENSKRNERFAISVWGKSKSEIREKSIKRLKLDGGDIKFDGEKNKQYQIMFV